MRHSLVLGIVLIVTMAAFFGCEVDQAITGVRIENRSGNAVTAVYIVPDGVSLDGAPNLLSGTISDGDFREFETGVGVFDIQVEVAYEGTDDFADTSVSDQQVRTLVVTDPFVE